MIEYTLENTSKNKLSDHIRKQYEIIFKEILELDVSYLKSIADINTIKYMSKKIYRSDLEFCKKHDYPVDIYKTILD